MRQSLVAVSVKLPFVDAAVVLGVAALAIVVILVDPVVVVAFVEGALDTDIAADRALPVDEVLAAAAFVGFAELAAQHIVPVVAVGLALVLNLYSSPSIPAVPPLLVVGHSAVAYLAVPVALVFPAGVFVQARFLLDLAAVAATLFVRPLVPSPCAIRLIVVVRLPPVVFALVQPIAAAGSVR